MDADLLATRLRVPPPSRSLLRRPALIDALERDAAVHKLIHVSAPAGYGKTTTLALWARESLLDVSWLTVDVEDNDPHRLFRYLIAAWSEVRPEIGQTRASLLANAMDADLDACLAAFLNAGVSVSRETAFVLDDSHLLTAPEILRSLTFLIDHLPSALHFVMAGRSRLDLPLARYRARGEIKEYGAGELCFGRDESAAFMRGIMGLSLDDRELQSIHEQVEGWPAGVQLVSLSRRMFPGAGSPAAITGRHRFIADYVRDEVLAWLPDDTRRFLLETSILDRLAGDLCDAVTGRTDSQDMLEALERENLFLIPLDDERRWYRFHRLFADVLRTGLGDAGPNRVNELHRKAARWYLDHDLPEPAFSHAVEADDDATGVHILDRCVNDLVNAGQLTTLRRWVESIPERWRDLHPVIGLAEAALFLMAGAFESVVERIDDVERRLGSFPPERARPQLARVSALRCYISCFRNDLENAESYADDALRGLLPDDVAYRADIFHALGDTYRQHGRWEEARSSYLSALEAHRRRMASFRAAHVYGALADLDLLRGHLRSAHNHWLEAMAAIQDRESRGRVPLPVMGWVYLCLGEMFYEWNDLQRAREDLQRGAKIADLGGDVRSLIVRALLRARILLAEGRGDDAAAALEEVQTLVSGAAFPDLRARVQRCQVDIWLAQDRRRAIADWVHTVAIDDRSARPLVERLTDLAVARALVAIGDESSLARAIALLEDVIRLAGEDGQTGVQIEGLALQALVHFQQRRETSAMISIEHALHNAEPEGYVRLFVDLGEPMARLLQGARRRQTFGAYVDALLDAFGVEATSESTRLPEPLSPRERDVLALVAAGLTNDEIANQLFISPETVKKHTSSIYGKLGVRNRIEATDRARTIGLLHDH